MFIGKITFFSGNALDCISINNQECKIRPQLLNITSNNSLFYRYNIQVSGSCNNSNDLFAKLCVPDVFKNITVKVVNLMSKTNGARQIKWHESCKYKYRLDASVYNNKQRCNKDKCRCECAELTDRGKCNKGFIWNSSNCDSECDKSFDVGEYLNHKSCKCRKKIADQLVK